MHSIWKKIFAAGASAALAVSLAGCGEIPGVAADPSASAQATESAAATDSSQGDSSWPSGSASSDSGLSEEQIAQAVAPDKTDMKNKDLEENWSSGAPQIQLNGDSASCDDAAVSIDGSIVTISQGGSYVLTGSLNNGRIIVDAPDTEDVQLVLNGANIASADGPGMRFNEADKVILTLAGGTENSVTDGQTYADETATAAVYAETDLSINGAGALTVTGNYKNGIATKDDLKVANGTINVKAANDALKGKDSVSILNGTFTLEAGGDGIRSDKDDDLEKGWIVIDGGTFKITAEEDAVQAETGLTINGGEFDVTTGGGYENGEEHTGNWGFSRPDDFGGMRPGGGQPGVGTDDSSGAAVPTDGSFDGTRPQRPNRGDRSSDASVAPDAGASAEEQQTAPQSETVPQFARNGGAETVMASAPAEAQTLEEAPVQNVEETPIQEVNEAASEAPADNADVAEPSAEGETASPDSEQQADSAVRGKRKGRAQDGAAAESSADRSADRHSDSAIDGTQRRDDTARNSSADSSNSSSDSRKGIKAGGVLTINGGNFNLNCADDTIHTNGSASIAGGAFTLSSGDDGIHADGDLTISAGDIAILESYEGLEACKIFVQGGDIDIKSSDDGINAADGSGGFGAGSDMSKFDIQISGGTINAVCGGDGIDSNGDIHISGGDTHILIDSTADNCAIDAERTFTVTGGNIVYGGTGTGAGPGTDSTQSYVFAQASFAAGTEVSVRQNGQTLISFAPSIDCSSLSFSTPAIVSGQSYEIYSGDTLVTAATAGQGSSGMTGMGHGGPGGRPDFSQGGTNGEPPAMPSDGQMPEGTPPAMPSDGQMPEGTPPGMPSDGQKPNGQRPRRNAADNSAQSSDGTQAIEPTLEEAAAV